MMKNLLQEVRTFVLLLFSSFLFCHSGVCLCVSGGGGVFVHSQLFLFFFFLYHILLPGLKFDVLNLSVLFLYSTPQARASHESTVTSP